MQPPSRILLIRFSSLGDIVLTSPVTRALRQRYPDAEIAITVKRAYEPLARLLPGVDTVIAFDPSDGFSQLRASVRQRHFDLMIDLHANLRSRLLTRSGGAPHIIRYRKRRIARMGMVYNTRLSIPTRHTVDLYLDALAALDITGSDRHPSLAVHAAARATVLDRLRTHGVTDDHLILGLAPGASSPTKQWPVRHFVRLADQYRQNPETTVLLVGGEHDRETSNAVTDAMAAPSIDWTGSIDLSLLPAVIERCHVLVSNDSGPMHVASAVGTPVIGLFGPTHPRLGFAPLGDRDMALSLDLECSPCSLHGEKPCWKDTHACLEELRIDRVIQEITQHLPV